MTGPERLTSLGMVAGGAARPGYEPAEHGHGIVHLGVGAFHRAHQAVCTDEALAAAGGDWRIIGASLRGTQAADALNPQNGLYTLLERDGETTRARVIASISQVIAATRDREALLAAMTDPAIRIVSLTVTEKAYGIDRAAGGIDMDHPAVAADLAEPRSPSGVLGLLTESLRLRRRANIEPFTVLCCDNLPENGNLLRKGVTGFAEQLDPELATWIGDNVAFPSTMVDRITPAPTDRTLADAATATGCQDLAAVETEPFSQWVIEDRFPTGRPQWEAGGALFVDDVAPYERMKLRMLNGAHSMLAYAGYLAGHRFVRDAMADTGLTLLVQRQMRAAAATLEPLAAIDLGDYEHQLIGRFSNRAIAHETYQIAMDGTEKLPQRVFQPALDAIAGGQDIRPFAFATAAWMRYCLGADEVGEIYALRDPREAEIASRIAGVPRKAGDISAALHSLPGLFPPALAGHAPWRRAVEGILDIMLTDGVVTAIRSEAAIASRPDDGS